MPTESHWIKIPEENECLNGHHDCDPNAHCRDLDVGFTCECKPPFFDKSPNFQKPGRFCVPDSKCPPDHTCSPNAVCEPLGSGKYTVKFSKYFHQVFKIVPQANDLFDQTIKIVMFIWNSFSVVVCPVSLIYPQPKIQDAFANMNRRSVRTPA